MVDSVRERVDAAKDANATYSPGTLADAGAGPQDVEDSIQRTQMFLRQRLAQRNSGNAAGDARAAAFATGDGGGEAGQALDAQELAAQAYERQRAEKMGSGGSPTLKAPSLSPARPKNSINGLKTTD